METGKQFKNQFNPMIGRMVQTNGSTPQRDVEYNRIRQTNNKYQYVVDWQIEEENTARSREIKSGNDLPDIYF
jgi:hypothetical protein